MFNMCFTGHRKIGGEYYNGIHISNMWQCVFNAVEHVVRDAVSKKVCNFICGGAIGADMLCAEVVLKVREDNPHIKLIIARPFPSQAKNWPTDVVLRYNGILDKANHVIDVSDDPYSPEKMELRNRWMIDNSHYVFAIKDALVTKGGTVNAINYATECKKILGVLDARTSRITWHVN